ncbi:kunitz-type protease inhibitor 1-like [Carcharodon carcharias]|uniref:kunitz-type protease inhibitor 1-like n=1 Tax=Carcharodon carcharias TaxID=13397 RepID=UPI001B7DFC07|nr:kunitz-type protease inhibitor 1-like [Carcharodon carcharias]
MSPRLAQLLPYLLYLSYLPQVSLVAWRDQPPGRDCLSLYRLGRDDFVLDTDDSVSAGATFLGSPNVSHARDCVSICCRTRGCNVVLLEDTMQQSQEDAMLRKISGCFLFNCLYNQVYVCRFFRREGFSNFIQNTVYEDYFRPRQPTAGDELPVANAGRDRIVQPNEEVILSGVESRDNFKIVSFDWTLLHGDSSVKFKETKNQDERVVSNLQVGSYVFKLTVTDTAGQKTTDNMTVTVLSPEQSDEYCKADQKVGPCRGSFHRWRYAADKGICESFIYGGCKGNKNNYVDEKECMQACSKVKGDTKSSGRSNLPHCTGECTEHQFKCGDNCCIDSYLECDETPHCSDSSDEASCQQISEQFNILLDIDIPKEKARCTFPPVTGRCRADFSRFYYNPYTKSCERFTYGGCEGNGNRFEKEDTCMQACRGVTEKDVFSRSLFEKQKQGSSSNANIAIAVVLAICIAAVLTLLIYFLLKMRKQNRRQTGPPSSTDSTDEVKKLMAMQSKPI